MITGWIYLCGGLSIVFVVMIFLFVFKEAFPLLREYSISAFLTGTLWAPTEQPEKFGLVPLLLSSVMVTLGAVVIAIPLGLMTAIYLAEIAPARIRDILKPAVELLAAIPSVVLGFFGVTVLAPFLAQTLKLDIGLSMLAGSITLAFMAVPTIATISEDALSSVGKDLKQGSLALGATRWETIRRVGVPAAFSGIMASIMLGIGRAIGETMVVLMVTGSGVGDSLKGIMTEPLQAFRWVFSAYGEICNTITATIASDMGEAVVGSAHYHALFLLGVVLFVITFIINLVADAALRKGHLQQ
ncbi:MAG: phosphate ABC transporter permease subunit PstC [Fibrella sp.]|nr:phosphate ABC transporter permease subunit PstC [Armatimonadota bacterium]